MKRPRAAYSQTGISGSFAVIHLGIWKAEIRYGSSQTLLLGRGYIENPEDAKWSAPGVINKEKAHAMMERYNSDAAFDRALAALWDHWSRLLDGYQVSSGDEKLDRMVNIWNQYQCMVTFNMSRSASYLESGMGRGMGFRDSCQALLGFVHMIPPAGEGTYPGHRRHPVPRRQRLSPVSAPDEKGIVSLTVNGTPVTGNVLPPAAPGTEVRVRVVMG